MTDPLSNVLLLLILGSSTHEWVASKHAEPMREFKRHPLRSSTGGLVVELVAERLDANIARAVLGFHEECGMPVNTLIRSVAISCSISYGGASCLLERFIRNLWREGAGAEYLVNVLADFSRRQNGIASFHDLVIAVGCAA